jgi:hypothetical protein
MRKRTRELCERCCICSGNYDNVDLLVQILPKISRR